MMTRASTSLERLLPRGLSLGVLAALGCSLEFKGQQEEYGLSEASLELLDGSSESRQSLLEELELLFGSAAAPHFAAPAQSMNPSGSLAGAPDDLAAADIESIRRGNLVRFEGELAHVAANEFESLGPWKLAPVLTASWEQLVETEGRSPGFQETARSFFTDYYPTLRDSAALYGNKCLHCHGNEGGGDGPTSYTARPFPRDFRLGIFKYDNLKDGARPERGDLTRTIRRGIEGTAMPSLEHLSPAEIHGLADYARFLAIRGEVELLLALEFEDGGTPSASAIDREFGFVLAQWREAERKRVVAPSEVPPASAPRIVRGFELFHDTGLANCASCHGVGGRGEGTAVFGASAEDTSARVALMRDAWGHESIPVNLLSGRFRHGDGPRELYERIYLGIDGTPMAGLGGGLTASGDPMFAKDDIWALVHYVRAITNPEWSSLLAQLEGEAP